MIVDWNSPASIAAWYAVFPARHGPLIAWKARIAPQFAESIMVAGQMIRRAA